jgi:hypothetical protein
MAVPPTPLPDKYMAAGMFTDDDVNGRSPNHSPLLGDIFGGHYRQKDYVDSFAEKHVKLAKQTSEEQLWTGRKLLEGVQGKHLILSSIARRRGHPRTPALLIITWWYWCQARYVGGSFQTFVALMT